MATYKKEKLEDKGKFLVVSLSAEGMTIDRVSVWPTLYGGKVNPLYDLIKNNEFVEGVVREKGEYKNLEPLLQKPTFLNKPSIEKAQERKAEYIKEAQSRKDNSIAFFNATNSAIALYASVPEEDRKNRSIQEFIINWRDWFLSEWDEYNKQTDA